MRSVFGMGRLASCLWLTGVAGGACDRPVVYVTVLDLPDGTEAVRVQASLQGDASFSASELFTRDIGRFSASLPPRARGTLALSLQTLSERCTTANGSGSMEIEQDGLLGMTIRMRELASPACPDLRIQRIGSGQGRVFSFPTGVDCGSTCRFTFPEKTRVQLHAEASEDSFARFGAPCLGFSSCEVTVEEQTPQVLVSFSPKNCANGFCWENPVPYPGIKAVGSTGRVLFGVGNAGLVQRWDGAAWQPMTAETPENLRAVGGIDVAGSPAPLAFAVGESGAILQLQGSVWKSVYKQPHPLNAVWAADSFTAFAVGERGAILAWNGSTWRPMESPTTNNLLAIGGLRAGLSDKPDQPFALYACGENGSLLHLDGSRWVAQKSQVSSTLRALVGVPEPGGTGRVFAVGAIDGGMTTILQWDGQRWFRQTSPTAQDLYGITGQSLESLLASGPAVTLKFRPQNGDWIQVGAGKGVSSSLAMDRTGMVVGVQGTLIWPEYTRFAPLGVVSWNGTDWQPSNAVSFMSFSAVHGRSPEDITAVGTSETAGMVVQRNNRTWEARNTGARDVDLSGVWRSPSGALYVSGNSGLLKFDGQKWALEQYPYPCTPVNVKFSQVVGFDDGFILAGVTWNPLNSCGSVWRWDGTKWNVDTLPGKKGVNIQAFTVISRTDAYAAGAVYLDGDPDRGTSYVYHWDGANWSTVGTFPGVYINALYGDKENLWIGGSDRTLLQKDGTNWRTVPIHGGGPDMSISGLHGLAPDSIYGATYDGLALFYDGMTWRAEKSPAESLSAVLAVGRKKAVFVGSNGTILSYQAP